MEFRTYWLIQVSSSQGNEKKKKIRLIEDRSLNGMDSNFGKKHNYENKRVVRSIKQVEVRVIAVIRLEP